MRNFYFYNNSSKAVSEKKVLREQLTKLIEDNKELVSPSDLRGFEYMLQNAGVAGLKKTRAKLNRLIKAGNTEQKTLIVVAGNTYPIKENLSHIGFRITKEAGHWVHFLEVSSDKFKYWAKAVNELSQDLYVFNARSVRDVISDLEMAIQIDKEEKEALPKEEKPASPPHELDGAVLECTKWYGKIIQGELNTPVIFRNIKITKIHAETARAYQADFELFGGIASSCGVCGRDLDNEISRACGIGPVCASKFGLPRPTMKNAREITKKLEELSKEAGAVFGKWIPKSQVTAV